MTFDNWEENKKALEHFPDLAQMLADLPNYQVVNGRLSRGAQPTANGFKTLRGEGVRTVINLRSEALESEEASIVRGLGMVYRAIPLELFTKPKDSDIVEFLELAASDSGHVFVHCLHGQDRTGMMIAIYRMVVDGFTFKDAYTEMLALGFHKEFTNLSDTARRYENRTLLEVIEGHSGRF